MNAALLRRIGFLVAPNLLQPALPSRPGRMVRCGLSATNKRFPEYPATPVETCDGFRPMPEEYRT